MCGIFFCLKKNSSDFSKDEISIFEKSFDLLNNRGPDYSYFNIINNKIFAFKRLSINDLTPEGNQPFFYPSVDNNTHLSMCNGEIYNHLELEKKYNLKMKSHSDCECLIPLYNLFTFSQNRIEKKLG